MSKRRVTFCCGASALLALFSTSCQPKANAPPERPPEATAGAATGAVEIEIVEARAEATGVEDREPAVTITPVPGAKMTVRRICYGPGLAWTSHLRVGRREVSNWYDSPSGALRETGEATVTRKVTLLGRECFEVRVRERKAGEAEWSEEYFQYFWVAEDGTHWIRPRGDVAGTPDLADDSAWELQDDEDEEGAEGFEISTEETEGQHEGYVVEVVDLRVGGRTIRCLRETFTDEEPPERILYGGDAFMRPDGTTVYYRRLVSEHHREYPGLEGAPEYQLAGTRLRVWESVLLVEEES